MKLIGDRAFYKNIAKIALPIMIQNSVSFMINFVDNIMVGQLGTQAMSGVAIVNQLIFVFNTCILGIIAGASIFGAQFYGSKNEEGLKSSFRFRIITCVALTAAALVLFVFWGEGLIGLFLHSENQMELSQTLSLSKNYLVIILVSLLPSALTQVYASTAKDTGKTVLPMCASVSAVLLNTLLNYILIFGKLGLPALGIQGAAIATVIARFVECFIIMAAIHIQKGIYPFAKGAYRPLKIEAALAKRIAITSTPLLINEIFWSVGTVVVVQCYSVRGIEVVASVNIATTIYHIFSIFYMAAGGCIAILVGQLLGAGKLEEARDTDNKLIFLAVASGVVLGVLMALCAPFIPKLYNATAAVRETATGFIYVLAACIVISSFVHAAFFTIRAGGKTLITFLFDSSVLWLLRIPLAFILTRYTGMSIIYIYLICEMTDIVKAFIGFILLKKGVWVHRIAIKTSAWSIMSPRNQTKKIYE